jgi:hypothetical protein
MTRSELEHLIRASGAIANDNELIVIGSQSILGQFPEAPAALRASMETDLYPKNKPELAELIDGSIGEGSYFHEEFGYYAQGVGPKTAVLPAGWGKRLIRIDNVNTNGIAGLCLEVHDLAISKYVASRPKDRDFTRGLARHGLTRRQTLKRRLDKTTLTGADKKRIRSVIDADFRKSTGKKTPAA